MLYNRSHNEVHVGPTSMMSRHSDRQTARGNLFLLWRVVAGYGPISAVSRSVRSCETTMWIGSLLPHYGVERLKSAFDTVAC